RDSQFHSTAGKLLLDKLQQVSDRSWGIRCNDGFFASSIVNPLLTHGPIMHNRGDYFLTSRDPMLRVPSSTKVNSLG
ncbi:MAG: hypothetical protein VW942_06520, partial [Aquiluna sp.]